MASSSIMARSTSKGWVATFSLPTRPSHRRPPPALFSYTYNPVTNAYDTTVFDPTFNFTINEGAQFVECDAVTPTPHQRPRHTLLHANCDGNSDIYAYSYSNVYAYSYGDVYAYCYGNLYGDSDSDIYADSHCHRNRNGNANSTATPTSTPNCQFSTSITSNFNGTPINAGNYIWFTSVLKPNGLGSTPVTITFY